MRVCIMQLDGPSPAGVPSVCSIDRALMLSRTRRQDGQETGEVVLPPVATSEVGHSSDPRRLIQ